MYAELFYEVVLRGTNAMMEYNVATEPIDDGRVIRSPLIFS